MTKINQRLERIEKRLDSIDRNEHFITDVKGKDNQGNLILGKRKPMKSK